MARPKKQGLDYFPLDTGFLEDAKVRRILKACGANSPTILISLLSNIYKDYGYFVKWGDDLSFQISDKIVGVSEGAVIEVVNKAVQVNFFNPEMFKNFSILTSVGIQERFAKMTTRRNQIEIIKEYCLIDTSKMTKVIINSINVDINSINVDINSINAYDNSQSKDKVKVKDKVKDKTPDSADKKTTQKKFDVVEFLTPFNYSNDFKNTVWEFSKHRTLIKKPLSELALGKILKQLDNWGYSESQKIQCLNNSIMNGWQGVFELSQKQYSSQMLNKLNAQQETTVGRIIRLKEGLKSDS